MSQGTPNNSNGQATMANSSPVVVASDQSAIAVSATNLDIRDLTFAADKVDATGTVLGAGTNNIGDVDVLTLPSIPAGTNNIGDVDVASIAAGDNNIGNVDIVTMPDVTVVGKAADGAAVNGNPVLIAGQDGTNVQSIHTDTTGDLQVDVLTMPTTTVQATDLDIRNLVAATDIVDLGGNALTSLQLIDDTIKTLGTDTYTEAATKGSLIGAIRRDANTSAVNTDNEIAPLQVNATGDLKVAQILALPAGDNNIGNVDIVSGTITTVSTVTSLTQMNGAAISMNTGVRDAGTQRVTIATNDVVPVSDNSGSLTVDAPLATPVNVQVGNGTLAAGVIDETGASAVDALAVGGGTAHDAVDSGNPIKIGGVAVSGSATPTSVASGDRTRFIANQHGIPYAINGHPNLITREYDFGTAAQTDVNLAAALVAADERIYVTRLEVLCDSANTVAVSARAGFGTASVPTASSTGVSGMIASHPGIAAGSGIICGNGSGIIAVGGAGEEPRITTSAATTGNTHVIISYFLIDETP